jgi:hypothetical protein
MTMYSRDELSNMRREAQEDGQVIEDNEPVMPAPPTVAPWEQPWDKERFNTLFLSRGPVSDYAITKAIVFLYARQTQDERRANMTKEHNGRGFTGTDGEFLSSVAKRLEAGLQLTPGIWKALRRTNEKGFCVLAKYHGQLQEAVAAKAKAKAYAVIDAAEAVQ